MQYEFISTEKYHIEDRGDVYMVLAPHEYKRDECPFLGKEVLINGIKFLVIAVESYAISPTRKGSRIGLLVTDMQEQNKP